MTYWRQSGYGLVVKSVLPVRTLAADALGGRMAASPTCSRVEPPLSEARWLEWGLVKTHREGWKTNLDEEVKGARTDDMDSAKSQQQTATYTLHHSGTPVPPPCFVSDTAPEDTPLEVDTMLPGTRLTLTNC